MIALKDGLGNVVQRLPDDADLSAYDLTGLTAEASEFNDPLIPDLASARVRQRALVNAGRDAAINGGLPTSFGVFDSDLDSRSFIAGAVQLAREAADAAQPFAVAFTLADDSEVELDGPQMRQAGVEIGLQVGAIHARARVLKARIEAAETLAEVLAIAWSLEDPQ